MKKISRKKFLKGFLASISISGLSVWLAKDKILTWIFQSRNSEHVRFTEAPGSQDAMCVLTSESGEGPFYFNSPFRKDIREGKKGKKLDLSLQIVSHPECRPLRDVIVEIWQCDAQGLYSGYPDLKDSVWEFVKLVEFGKKIEGVEPINGEVFLRGAQVTDRSGMVDFNTIVPSWYTPRLPHIHFKVRTNDKEYISSELHFEDAFCDILFTTTEPYLKKGKSPYNHRNDKLVANLPAGRGLMLSPREKSDGGLQAFAKIGVERVI